MIAIPKIKCSLENHNEMIYQYVCQNSNCLKQSRELSCFYCCQEQHKNHIQDVVSLKIILQKIVQNHTKAEQNILQMLLSKIRYSSNEEQLKTNVTEIISYDKNRERNEVIIDEEIRLIQQNMAKKCQSNKNKVDSVVRPLKIFNVQKPFTNPILAFQNNQFNNFEIITPFSIKSNKTELSTAFAYPSLSKLYQSIKITIRVERYTPSWLAIGLSIGQVKYQQNSPHHVLAISNGWIANKGKLERSKVKFGLGDELSISWNKNTQIVQFWNNKDKHTVKFEVKWDQDIYLCVCLYYKGDSVSLLA